MTVPIAFAIGLLVGLLTALAVAGLVWISKTHGNDRPLTDEQIRKRVNEVWG